MNAIQQLLTEHIAIWTAADTEKKSGRGRSSGNAASVYGIKKLRELILELAVRGKLVPQDANDEPACALLKRIQAEKAKLIAEGKIKKDKPLPPITEGEKPFELPQGWEWVRFGDVYALEYGDNLPADKRSNSNEYPVYGSNGIVGSHSACFVKSPCIVVGRKGSAGALNLSRAKGCCVTDVAYYCIPPHGLDLAYSFKLFHTLGLDTLGKGIKPGLNRNEAYVLPLAVPPIEEQHRIVAKVDELMALCDQLETRHNNAAAAHEKLVSHLLAALTQSQSTADFGANWQRITAHFDTLFTTEAGIDALKQTLLQLAVMGKLVPQDPNDENVERILMRSDAKRCEIARSDRRADVDLQPLLSAEDCWKIPEAWTWRGLADLVLFVDYRGQTPTKLSDGVRLLTAKNVRKGQINLSPEEFLSEHDYREWMTRGFPQAGDVLFTTEAPMGNAAVVELTEQFALAQRVICFQSYGALDSSFLAMQILSDEFQYLLDKNGTGVTAKGIKASKLKQLPIAVPPIAEQHRIVAKVDELMALCDQLKTRLAAANQLQQKLADVVVEQAIA